MGIVDTIKKRDSLVAKKTDFITVSKHNQEIVSLRNLKPGQTFKGEVVAIDGQEIKLQLSDNTIITAKLDKNIQVTLGQEIKFQVKSNSDSLLELKPILDTNQNKNVLKALKAAELPINDKTLALVNALMDEGLPIDKETIKQLYKQILSNQDSNPTSIVQMNRLQIPISTENIEQFEAYKNYRHQLIKGVESVSNEIPKVWQQLIGEGKSSQAVDFYSKLIEVIIKDTATNLSPNQGNQDHNGNYTTPNLNSKENQAQILNNVIDNLSSQESKGQTINQVINSLQSNEIISKLQSQESKGQTINEVINNLQSQGKQAENAKVIVNALNPEKQVVAAEASRVADLKSSNLEKEMIKQILKPSERATLAKLLEPLQLPEKTMEQIKEGIISNKDVLKLVQSLAKNLPETLPNNVIKEIFDSKEFTKLIKEQVVKQWTLEPAQVNQNRNVEELYGRMREQTMNLLKVLASVGKEDTTMMKSVTNIRNNIDFMNQLNQLISYVQLPVKMGKGNAHGELYVYTNKKNLSKKDGKVSALLHLDMDHLGTLDVYVAMDQGKVSSKFYLENEEILNFIEKNVPILVERLQKRGYHMDVEVLKRGKSETIMEHIIEEEKPGQLLSKTAFDVRA